jgi:hypothetical protein
LFFVTVISSCSTSEHFYLFVNVQCKLIFHQPLLRGKPCCLILLFCQSNNSIPLSHAIIGNYNQSVHRKMHAPCKLNNLGLRKSLINELIDGSSNSNFHKELRLELFWVLSTLQNKHEEVETWMYSCLNLVNVFSQNSGNFHLPASITVHKNYEAFCT